MLHRFSYCCFGQFTYWDPGEKCNRALHHIISRTIESDDDMLWFHICGQRVCFTPSDFALITGLRFGPAEFDTGADHDLSANVTYLAFCEPDRGTSIVDLIRTVINPDNGVVDVDGNLHLRATLVCVAHTMICGGDRQVEPWMWALVHDLDAFNRFPWGAYSYRVMTHYTRNCPGKASKYSFYGPAWALYVWGLEKVPGLAEEVGISVADQENKWPRILRWRFNRYPRTDLQPLFEDNEVRTLLCITVFS